MLPKKKSSKPAIQPSESWALLSDDAGAIMSHPIVLIASRSVRRELGAIAGWRFVGKSVISRDIVSVAKEFEEALELLKKSLILVTADRVIHRNCTSCGSRRM
jgi:hypothetical protein